MARDPVEEIPGRALLHPLVRVRGASEIEDLDPVVDVGPERGWTERVLDSDGDAVRVRGEVGAGLFDIEEEEDASLATGELRCRHFSCLFGGDLGRGWSQ